MRISNVIVIAALVTMFGSTSQAALPLGAGPGDDVISLIYNPMNGNLALDAAGKLITTLEIQSAAGYFTGTPADGMVQPPFDVYTPNKYFLLRTSGIGDTDLGNVLPSGLTCFAVAADLTVLGSLKPFGSLGTVDMFMCPEPSCLLPLGLGFMGVLRVNRRRHDVVR
ncbi:MAG: hypothetical protein KDB23_06980 [Planctomycetales bacterium]|nr:hypothetical protein [Planctomycetales bacterium]